jgi:crotonobetainyl-CoA:carnitine CoA-transferase CaiB-like acyl-CoA transferase
MAFEPLSGIRVLDLTSSLAGPTATEILGALGADVVKIEHPGRGDEARDWGPRFYEGGSVMFFAANAGKRSLGLDLKSPQGLEVLLRLASDADVVVQSLRPGTAERLGLGPEALRERNPGLVYATIGAFGRNGPLASEPGYDPLMQAAAGIMSVTGEAGGHPVRVGVSLIDIGTGVWAALAIVAALHEGQGRTVDLSLYETAISLAPYQLVDVLAGGAPPGRHGTAFPLIVPYQVFETSDGELMVVAANDRLYAKTCRALGAPELVDDERFATNPLRVANRDELIPLLQARIATETTADLLARLRDAGVPASPVNDLAGVAQDAQLRATGILQELAGRELVSPPFSADGERIRYRSESPLLGQHSREILTEAGYAEAEIKALVDARVVGLRAVDPPRELAPE